MTIVRRGERLGSSRPDYVWWQELPEDATAEGLRSLGYEVVEVVPVGHPLAYSQADPSEQERSAIHREADELHRGSE